MTRIEKTHLGFIGVGNMGMGMLTRWRSLGGGATAYDIEPACMQAARSLGADTVSSPRAVAAALGSDALLVVCVVDAAQCEDVFWGVNGVCESAPAGLTVLLTPTLGPVDVRAMTTRLASAGVAVIDAPMSGGPVRAAAGTMSLMVSGPTRRQWWFVLEALANPVFDLGDVIGDGAKTKLVNNLLAAINLVGAAQIMTLAARLDLDPQKTLAVIAESSGHSWIAMDRLSRVLAGDSTPRAHMRLLAKDSRLAMEAALGVGYSPEMGAIAQEHFAEALAAGMEAADDSAMWAFIQSLVNAKGTQP